MTPSEIFMQHCSNVKNPATPVVLLYGKTDDMIYQISKDEDDMIYGIIFIKHIDDRWKKVYNISRTFISLRSVFNYIKRIKGGTYEIS